MHQLQSFTCCELTWATSALVPLAKHKVGVVKATHSPQLWAPAMWLCFPFAQRALDSNQLGPENVRSEHHQEGSESLEDGWVKVCHLSPFRPMDGWVWQGVYEVGMLLLVQGGLQEPSPVVALRELFFDLFCVRSHKVLQRLACGVAWAGWHPW